MWSLGRGLRTSSFNSGLLATERHPIFTAVRYAVGMGIVIMSLAGCGLLSWTRVTINESLTGADVAFLVPGKTTLAEVVTKLGAPDELIGGEGGAIARYYYRDVKYFRVNYGWPLRFISVVSLLPHDLITAGGGLGTDVLQLGFDRRWIVEYHAFARHTPGTRYKPWPFGGERS
jgi:hypothetical protein